MINLYFWPTPNGHKITIFLEEAGLDYRIVPVDISAGDQFEPTFLTFSPNNRMPAIVDHPWIVPHRRQRQDLAQFPHLQRWFEAMRGRPAVAAAYARGRPWSRRGALSDESRKLLFGQTARRGAGVRRP